MQHARMDLVNWGEDTDYEKDRLLETFFLFAKSFADKVVEKHYWVDYIDPCSGLPMLTDDCNKVFSEVQSAVTLLHYSTQNAGCCKILLHPRWHAAVYPATIFTTAPKNVVLEAIDSIKG